jgi:hypothetical protein
MASDRPSSLPPVVLDANLLYPFQLRNLLVQFGADSVIAPRWTARIHEEWIGNLVDAGRAPRERLLLTLDLMHGAVPDADVRDWEKYMQGLATMRTRSWCELQQRWRTLISAEARHRSLTTWTLLSDKGYRNSQRDCAVALPELILAQSVRVVEGPLGATR